MMRPNSPALPHNPALEVARVLGSDPSTKAALATEAEAQAPALSRALRTASSMIGTAFSQTSRKRPR